MLHINQTGNGNPPPKDKPRDDEPMRSVPPAEQTDDESTEKK